MAAQFVDQFPGCSGESERTHHGANTLVSKHTEVTREEEIKIFKNICIT